MVAVVPMLPSRGAFSRITVAAISLLADNGCRLVGLLRGRRTELSFADHHASHRWPTMLTQAPLYLAEPAASMRIFL